jgi:hypothetical protein
MVLRRPIGSTGTIEKRRVNDRKVDSRANLLCGARVGYKSLIGGAKKDDSPAHKQVSQRAICTEEPMAIYQRPPC